MEDTSGLMSTLEKKHLKSVISVIDEALTRIHGEIALWNADDNNREKRHEALESIDALQAFIRHENGE